MDRYYADGHAKSRGYVLTLFNLSNLYGHTGMDAQALAVCETAIPYCMQHKRLYLLPHLKFNKACALFCLGQSDEDEINTLVTEAIYAMRNNGDYADAREWIEIAQSLMGISFPG